MWPTALMAVVQRRSSKCRDWQRKQVKPYPLQDGTTWKGEVMVGQCFYSFMALVDPKDPKTRWGGFLPDHADYAVTDWLQALPPLDQVSLKAIQLVLSPSCTLTICALANRAVNLIRKMACGRKSHSLRMLLRSCQVVKEGLADQGRTVARGKKADWHRLRLSLIYEDFRCALFIKIIPMLISIVDL